MKFEPAERGSARVILVVFPRLRLRREVHAVLLVAWLKAAAERNRPSVRSCGFMFACCMCVRNYRSWRFLRCRYIHTMLVSDRQQAFVGLPISFKIGQRAIAKLDILETPIRHAGDVTIRS